MTKYKLAGLNTFSAYVIFAFSFKPTAYISFASYGLFGLGTLFISMTSQALNQVTEREKDKLMKRTKFRPLALDKYSDYQVKKFAGKLAILSCICYIPLCYLDCYFLKTMVLSHTIIFLYNFVYTPLKRHSNIGTHIGAIVGALVPILGSCATTGLFYNQTSFVLAMFIFAWQYPHFYGINYRHRQCYSNAGFEFISKYPINDFKAKFQIFIALALMVMCGIKLYNIGILDDIFLGLFGLSMVHTLKNINNLTTRPISLMISSYLPFLLILGAFVFPSFEQRKEIYRLINNYQLFIESDIKSTFEPFYKLVIEPFIIALNLFVVKPLVKSFTKLTLLSSLHLTKINMEISKINMEISKFSCLIRLFFYNTLLASKLVFCKTLLGSNKFLLRNILGYIN